MRRILALVLAVTLLVVLAAPAAQAGLRDRDHRGARARLVRPVQSARRWLLLPEVRLRGLSGLLYLRVSIRPAAAPAVLDALGRHSAASR